MELTDVQILDYKIGDRALKDMGSLEFLGWISKKINGVSAYSAANQELVAAISNPPMGAKMPDEEKIRLVRKLISTGINLEV